MGAKLVVFNSQDEMYQIGHVYAYEIMGAAHGSHYFFWVGCTDADVEGLFECEDGTQLFLNSDLWLSALGYPESYVGGSGIEDCLDYFPTDNGLADIDCNERAIALCEVDPLPKPTNATAPAYPTSQYATTPTTPSPTTQDPTGPNTTSPTQNPTTTTTQSQATKVPTQPTTPSPATQTTTKTSTMQNLSTDSEQDGTTIANEVSSGTNTHDGACPDGWDSVVSGCYKFQYIAPDWSNVPSYGEAKVICADMGAKLVVFNSYDEMDNVGNCYAEAKMGAALGSVFNFWVGCTDADVEGVFECEDGTQLSLSSDLWLSVQGYPKSSVGGGGIEDCVHYLPNTQGLKDTDCNARLSAFALCEIDPLPEPTTTTAPADPTTQEATTPSTPGQTSQDPTTTPTTTTGQTSQDPTTTPTTTTGPTTQDLTQPTTTNLPTQDPATPTTQSPTNQDPKQPTTTSPTQNPTTTTTPRPVTQGLNTPSPATQGPTAPTTTSPTTQDPTKPTVPGPTNQTTTKTSTMQNLGTDSEQDGTTIANEVSSGTNTDATPRATPLRKISKSNVFLPGKDNNGRNLIGYCLVGHVMETERMVSQLRCAMMCADIVGCQSFNYIQGGVCELNYAQKERADARFFTRSDGCTYFGRA
ncbi:mucin-2-like [Lytechinus variegatus]|uniref:mucin-2-like n=1 Tax=Lytechinus variegatus TaxID=7654 RepID=UPI001BB0EE1E|nr:mucin-2-like [Lytechinus variegatus]